MSGVWHGTNCLAHRSGNAGLFAEMKDYSPEMQDGFTERQGGSPDMRVCPGARRAFQCNRPAFRRMTSFISVRSPAFEFYCSNTYSRRLTVRMASQRATAVMTPSQKRLVPADGNSRNSDVSKLVVLSSVGMAWGTSPCR